MTQRDWLVALTAAIIVLLTVAAFMGSGLYSDFRSDIAENKQYCDSNQGRDKEGKEIQECKGSIYRAITEPAALATWVLTAFTAFLVVFTGGLFVYAVRQGIDVREANRLSAQLVELDRAWIGAPRVEILNPEGNKYGFLLTFTNKGKMVATSVSFAFKSVDRYEDVHGVLKRLEEDGLKKYRFEGATALHTIVPGDEFIVGSKADRGPLDAFVDLDAWDAAYRAGAKGGECPHLVGYILYGPALENGAPRKTPFFVTLSRTGDSLEIIRPMTVRAT